MHLSKSDEWLCISLYANFTSKVRDGSSKMFLSYLMKTPPFGIHEKNTVTWQKWVHLPMQQKAKHQSTRFFAGRKGHCQAAKQRVRSQAQICLLIPDLQLWIWGKDLGGGILKLDNDWLQGSRVWQVPGYVQSPLHASSWVTYANLGGTGCDIKRSLTHWPGAVAQSYNFSTLGGRGGKITWGQEFETSLANIVKPCLYQK